MNRQYCTKTASRNENSIRIAHHLINLLKAFFILNLGYNLGQILNIWMFQFDLLNDIFDFENILVAFEHGQDYVVNIVKDAVFQIFPKKLNA